MLEILARPGHALTTWLLAAPTRDPAQLEQDVPAELDANGEVAQAVTAVVTSIDLVGVFFFAASGAILAARKGYDIIGSLLLALMVGTGGGVIRDLVINRDVPAAFQNPWYLILPAFASLAVFLRILDENRGRHAVMVFDAIGLAVYCVIGTRIALIGGLSPVAAVVLGMVTAVGGGLLRDVVAGEPPAVFGGRGWYGLPALLGSALTAGLGAVEWLDELTSTAVMVFVLLLRVVSLRKEWVTPGAEITGEAQRRRLSEDEEAPVPDVRDRKGEPGPPAETGEPDSEPEAEAGASDADAQTVDQGRGAPHRSSRAV